MTLSSDDCPNKPADAPVPPVEACPSVEPNTAADLPGDPSAGPPAPDPVEELDRLLNSPRPPVEVPILDLLPVDRGMQVREGCNPDAVSNYATAMNRGDALPPIRVIKDRGRVRVFDGFHRLDAAISLGRESVACTVYEISRNQAELLAIRSNVVHGRVLGNAEKAAAVNKMLAGSNSTWSDNHIAGLCGVSAALVAARRKLSGAKSPTRTAVRRGVPYQMRVDKIGRATKSRAPAVNAPPASVQPRSTAIRVADQFQKLEVWGQRAGDDEWRSLVVAMSDHGAPLTTAIETMSSQFSTLQSATLSPVQVGAARASLEAFDAAFQQYLERLDAVMKRQGIEACREP
ncbi:ParB/RepB/Spo0J family partition protein [Humisphaera borealis]|uniref:ParB-like nuclease domain-containing protein n=1 Tax=Humisphaera borealis TaxID=2807512 RepID=A0A7M2WW28_9BACT|nr:ParB/RepB/Spo0J family partition protein [Humisphaera borealis]QOV89757.1 ParB-like nuclease domain-containing protein [Humisphaera borealis]